MFKKNIDTQGNLHEDSLKQGLLQPYQITVTFTKGM